VEDSIWPPGVSLGGWGDYMGGVEAATASFIGLSFGSADLSRGSI